MTDAEKAVIEAAERWAGYTGKLGRWDAGSEPDMLERAVYLLRASRRPSPRWGVGGISSSALGFARYHLSFDGENTSIWGSQEAIEALAAMLNGAAK